MPTKQEILLGKGPLGREQECKGTQENCSATWLAVSGFMVMGLVSGLSLPNHLTQSLSWGCTPCLAKWMPERRILGGGRTCGFSFDLSQTLPVGGGLLVLCSLQGPPVNNSCKWLLWCLARVGSFNQCVLPLTILLLVF